MSSVIFMTCKLRCPARNLGAGQFVTAKELNLKAIFQPKLLRKTKELGRITLTTGEITAPLLRGQLWASLSATDQAQGMEREYFSKSESPHLEIKDINKLF